MVYLISKHPSAHEMAVQGFISRDVVDMDEVIGGGRIVVEFLQDITPLPRSPGQGEVSAPPGIIPIREKHKED